MKNNIVYKSLFHNPLKILLLLMLNTILGILIATLGKFFGQAFDIGISGTGEDFKQHIIKMLIALGLFITINFISKVIERQYYHRVVEETRIGIFNNICKKPLYIYTEEDYGFYSSSLINDVRLLEEQFFNPLLISYSQIINLVIALTFTLQISKSITMVIILASLVPIMIPTLLKKRLSNNFSNYSKSMGDYSSNLNELLLGFDVIKTYNAQTTMLLVHNDINQKTLRAKKSAFDFLNLVKTLVIVASLSIIIGVLLIGMFMSIKGVLTIGEVFAISFISSSISGPLGIISDSFSNIKASKKIIKKFDIEKDLKARGDNTNKLEKISRQIQLKDYSLKIEEKQILKNINCTFEVGKRYAIVGGSGSGKSTLINSIMGYHYNYEGDILVDDMELRTIDMNSIYDNIAYLPQTVSFFKGSIKENLSYFREKTEEEINKALEFSNIKDKIESLNQNLNSRIDRNLKEFSGGEKQRIAISRSLLRNKDIFILDEATSALDGQNYRIVEKNLLDKGETIIAVTHRLDRETLERYDEIIVLDKGEIVEKGDFRTVMGNKNYFYQIYLSTVS